jgi:hypothetical protein
VKRRPKKSIVRSADHFEAITGRYMMNGDEAGRGGKASLKDIWSSKRTARKEIYSQAIFERPPFN